MSQSVRAVILALLLGLFVRTFLVEAYVVESGSMSPSLLPGDHVLVNRLIYASSGESSFMLPQRAVQRGDVVALRRPGGEVLFKRVVARGGDVLELRDGRVLVDGRPEPQWSDSSPSNQRVLERVRPIRLRSREIYLLGDARPRSRDSRHWGPVREEWLRGRAVLIYWSSPEPGSPGPDSPEAQGGDWDKMPASVWLKIRSTHWSRCLTLVR